MKIKKYVADSMPEVLKLVKNDLGPKAVILNTRTVDKTGLLGKKGQVEVTAAVDDKPGAKKLKPKRTAKKPVGSKKAPAPQPGVKRSRGSAQRPDPGPPAATRPPATAASPADLSQLTAQIQALQSAIRTPVAPVDHDFLPGELAQIARQLDDDGLAASIGQDVIKHLLAEPGGEGFGAGEVLQRKGAARVAGRMPKPIPTQVAQKVRSVVALVGPSGVGKTTAAAKIAAQFASQGNKVSLITTDTDRVGGLEQIRAYAGILDLTVDVAYTVDEMHDVIKQRREVGLVLVDTGGVSPVDAAQLQNLNDLLREAGPSEVHLVLGATTGLQQMRDDLTAFSTVGVDRLLFTRLDETARFGAACTMAVESGVPMSYITNSRMVPGDLHPARPALLSTALFHRSLNGLLK